MSYSEDSLVPVMQLIAKNVVQVNEGRTKHMVSGGSVWRLCLDVLLLDVLEGYQMMASRFRLEY